MNRMKRILAMGCAIVLLLGTLVFAQAATTRSLSDFIDTEKLTAAFFFDGNLDAAYGTNTATAMGETSYVDGFNGKAVSAPGEAYVSTDLKFTEKSFSISLWINRSEIETGDPYLYGNQDWNNSRNTGFTVPMAGSGKNAGMAFSYQPTSTRIRLVTVFDAAKLDNWVHTMLIVDRENNVVKYYEDFEYVTETSIAGLGANSLDSGLPFTIGRDPLATYKYYADLTFDDLLVFDHAVSEDTLDDLKDYYYTPAESVAMSPKTVELQVGQGVAPVLHAQPAATLPRTATWVSSNKDVATVDQNGIVKAVAPGTATITGTVDGKSDTCTVTVTAAPDRKIYDHVVIVGLDGAGTFFDAEVPNIERIFAEGATTKECLVTSPSISAHNWSTLFTGVTPNLHEVTNDTSNATPYTKEEYPTLFKLVRESYPDYMISTFCTWQNIDIGCIENDIGVLKGDVVTGGPFARDADVAASAVEQITNESPNLLYLHFNGLDSRGHEFGFGGTKFNEYAKTVDNYVAQIYDAVQANEEMKDNTLFIVTADHGGTCPEDESGGSHGGWSDVERYVFFGAVGAGVNKTDALDMRLIDTAAIVTYALNAKGNPLWDSYVPKNLFTDYLDAPYKEKLAQTVTVPTPDPKDAHYIGNFVDTDKLEAAIFFDDGKNTDLMGNVTATNVGNVYYTDGYYGHGVELSCDGYVSVEDLTFGADSFSIGLWVNRTKIFGDPALYGNQDWSNSRNTGFTFPMRNAGLAANMAFSNLDEAVRIRFGTTYDEANYGEWVHTLLVVDRAANVVKYYENFNFVNQGSLEALGTLTLDSGLPFNLGQDGTGRYQNNVNAYADDLLVYNCAVTEEDVQDLETYYSFRNKGNLHKFIDTDGLTAAFFFDGNLNAAYGDNTALGNGAYSYVDGKLGKGVSAPGEAYVSTDLKFTEKSFSISLWINRGNVTGDPYLYGNQDWNNSRKTGFTVPMVAAGSNANTAFSYQPTSTRIRIGLPFPAEKLDNWVHTMLIVDRENNVVKYYEDFEYVTQGSIEGLGTNSLDSGLPFTIGRDPLATYKYYADLTFDDLLVFNHAVSEETLGKLEDYYNCENGNHDWSEYVSNEDATVFEDGTETATCGGCGATDTRTVEGSKLPMMAGDANNDRTVDTSDAIVLLQYLVGKQVEFLPEAADLNGDARISVYDAVELLRKISE